jgi:hypothetical protein
MKETSTKSPFSSGYKDGDVSGYLSKSNQGRRGIGPFDTFRPPPTKKLKAKRVERDYQN